MYGIPQAQSTGVPSLVYGILVQPEQSIPTESGYQPQHDYPP